MDEVQEEVLVGEKGKELVEHKLFELMLLVESTRRDVYKVFVLLEIMGLREDKRRVVHRMLVLVPQSKVLTLHRNVLTEIEELHKIVRAHKSCFLVVVDMVIVVHLHTACRIVVEHW